MNGSTLGSCLLGNVTAVPRRWNNRPVRARIWDVVVVVMLMMSVIATLTQPSGIIGPTGVVLTVVAAFILLLRRSSPGVAIMASLTATAAGVLAVPGASVDVAFLVALFAYAAARPIRQSAIAGAVFLLLEAVRLTPLHPPVTDVARFTIVCAVVAAIVGFGAYRHSRQQLVQQWQDRIADLEVQRETIEALARGAERLRLAQEMHDTVGHYLTVTIMMAEGGLRISRRSGVDYDHRTEDAFDTIATTARTALEETRAMLGVLRNNSANASMSAAADATLDSMFEGVRSVGLSVFITGRPLLSDLPAAAREVTVRVVQEALTNAIKYAGPGSSLTVTAGRSMAAFDLTVTDNGAGRALRQPPSSGAGLKSMRDRARQIGGVLDVGPVDPTGWSVRLHIPNAFP